MVAQELRMLQWWSVKLIRLLIILFCIIGVAHAQPVPPPPRDASDIVSGTFADARISESSVTQHEGALSITESQISDLGSYLTSESNDLSSSVTWTNVPDANIIESSVTQHESALTITESQISDLSHTTDTNLTEEEVEDFIGAGMSGNTETRITVTYQDADGTFDFVVDDMNDDVPESGDFGAADDLEASGELSADVVDQSKIADNAVQEEHLKAVDAASDEECLTYESTTGDFEWQSCGAGAESNDLTAAVTWANVPDANITESSVTQHEAALTITESQISDLDHTATDITAGIITEGDLNADNAPVDGDFLQYDSTGTNFVWRSGSETLSDIGAAASSHTHATSDVTSGTFADARISESSVTQHEAALSITESQISDLSHTTNTDAESKCNGSTTYLDGDGGCDDISTVYEVQLNNEAGLYAVLSDVTNFLQTGDALAGDDITDGTIDSSEIGDDTITHADIADADQADSKCFTLLDPVDTDDFPVWANKTANDFLITELWAESDQTVNFMLQVDDGSPADVDSTDLAPAGGEDEDTSLNGDTTVAAGEELELVTTSVSGTPTWLTVCFTGNWVD